MRATNGEDRRAVGHRIRAVRERRGWGRGELARRLGVHQGSIARWETGGAVPRGHTVRRIAELGGTTEAWLQTGAGDPAAPTPPEGYGDPFASERAVARFLADIAPRGREPMRKLDALEGLRRMLTARAELPGWWYALRADVESARL
jgi:transcriptional regulator with XRE-family HTH domain